MTSAGAVDGDSALIHCTFTGPVNAADFLVAMFATSAVGVVCIDVIQDGPNGLVADFSDNLSAGGDTVTLVTAPAGVVAPTTLPVTSI